MMEQPIEQRGDGGDVAQQLARVLDGWFEVISC
jgi:hypothetical protein